MCLSLAHFILHTGIRKGVDDRSQQMMVVECHSCTRLHFIALSNAEVMVRVGAPDGRSSTTYSSSSPSTMTYRTDLLPKHVNRKSKTYSE